MKAMAAALRVAQLKADVREIWDRTGLLMVDSTGPAQLLADMRSEHDSGARWSKRQAARPRAEAAGAPAAMRLRPTTTTASIRCTHHPGASAPNRC